MAGGIKRFDAEPQKEKRKISVGFVEPRKFDEDTIYVNLKLYHPRESFRIRMVSRREFSYDEFANQSRLTQSFNNVYRAGHIGSFDFSYFIERLGELNNAEIDYKRGWREGALAFFGLSKIIKDVDVLSEED